MDESCLTPDSRLFASQLFSRFPQLRPYAAIEPRSGESVATLVVTVSAPSGDPKAELVVWANEYDGPSVAFGDWHTHESVWEDSPENAPHQEILNLVEGILTERYVTCEDVGCEANCSTTILDLHDRDALLDELTDRYSPGMVRLRSWNGRHDRTVSLNDLEDWGAV